MTRSQLIIFATLGSAFLLIGAFGFQYLGGLAPCKMCLWQRWPHAAAIVIGAAALTLGSRFYSYVGAAVMLTGSAIGFFHAGVEQKWWDGPTTCTSSSTQGLSTDELLSQILNAPIVRCDDIAWQMLGISMAGWNGIMSLALVGIWLVAARRG